jgi:arylsulfatase A-like enzyme
VKVSDQFDYDTLLSLPSVPTLARMFRRAGYRAVSLKPGTTRESPHTRFYGFDVEYTAASFDYRGPHYAWSPMPDQYVLQQFHAREAPKPHAPIFAEFALVSSHYPFAPLPPFIEDPNLIGDGSLFRTLAPQAIPNETPNVSAVASAYLASIDYDLRVVFDYISHTIDDNTLVLVLGDHQPTAGVAGAAPTWSVPIHAISKNQKLLRSWRALGCTPGLVANPAEPHRGIETLIAQLMADYSLSPSEAP